MSSSDENQQTKRKPESLPADLVDESVSTAAQASGGWYSWYNQAKSKTISTFSMVQKDLVELSETVSQQASATVGAVVNQAPYVGQTAQDLGAKAGSWMKSLASTVNDVVLQMTDTTADEELNQTPIVVGASGPNSPRRSASFAAAKLTALQSDPNTFLNEPSGAPELFEDWLDHFSLADKKAEVLELLSKNDVMKRLYNELVPSKLSGGVFWERYFYRAHQLELDQAKLMQTFMLRVGSDSVLSATNTVESHDSWGDDSELDDLAAVMKERGLYNPHENLATPKNGDDVILDERTTAALLAHEDEQRRMTSSAVMVDEEREMSLSSATIAADEVCSENSFCLVRSNSSSTERE